MEGENKIIGAESELNSLFKKILDGLDSDLIEADENVQLYLTAVTSETGGKEMYGTLYNDALKIKGSARDRQLKFLNMFKDRVSKKEQMQILKKEDGSGKDSFRFDRNSLNETLKDFQVQPDFLKPVIKKNVEKIEDDDEEYDEDDFEG